MKLPNTAEAQLAEAIRKLGKAGFEAELWSFLRRVVGPDNLIILAYREAETPEVLFLNAERAETFGQLHSVYLRGAYLLDPYLDLLQSAAPTGAYRLADIAPDAFHRTRYFTDYYRQTTLQDEVAFLAYPAAGVRLCICIARDANSARPFETREIALIQRIAPLVVALCESHWAGLTARPAPPIDAAGEIMQALERQGITLTPRQAEVALLILQGHSSSSAAMRLGLSPQTVKVFRKQIYARCAISSQAELFGLLLPHLRPGLG